MIQEKKEIGRQKVGGWCEGRSIMNGIPQEWDNDEWEDGQGVDK